MKKLFLLKQKWAIVALSLVVSIVFISCDQDNNDTKIDDETTTTSVVKDDTYASETFQDASDLLDETSVNLKTATTSYCLLSDCAIVTEDLVSNPRVITIDFGTTGCTGADGKSRKGKIIATYGGDYWDDGAVKTITFENYYVDDNKVEGTKIVTAGARNEADNRFYTESVSGSIELAENGGTILWEATHSREVVEGSSTPLIYDDVYQLTGNSSGTTADGEEYSSSITSALVRKVEPGCRHNYVQGIIEITPIGKTTRVVDYGDGTCDRKATVTVDDNVYEVYLR
jgi:hypothetical protein